MKLALIGNMNNNHFAMMRYFRDLGVDAYLLKFSNEAEHFQPECDTYEFEKWAPYIIQTNIINGDYKQYLKFKPKQLFDLFSGYDFYIGNGFTPAYFYKAGLSLDLFLPYAVGIEFTYRIGTIRLLEKVKEKLIAKSQLSGLRKNVRYLGTADDEIFKKSVQLGITSKKLAIPMVYNRSKVIENSEKVNELIDKVNKFDFKIFSHVSHFPFDNWTYKLKRNDILIKSFASYIKCNPTHDSVLILLEYGENVKGSKNMITELGISDNVLWLPKMQRKEIMSIINHIDLGAAEFGGYFWGGTGWEFLSKGKLFFQFVDLTDAQIEDMIQMPVPPFVNSNDPTIIAEKMAHYHNQRIELKELSSTILDWFDKNAGINLAQKHLELLQN